MEYIPFQYPPNYELAHFHHSCSMPGKKIKESNEICPCCNQKLKAPFKNWITRNIDKDFRNYGGSVITYFWLLKLYIFIIGLIIVIYSVYQMYCIQTYCQGNEKCVKFLGMHIVSNEDLYQLINKQNNFVLVRLFTLRGLAFAFLLIGNCVSLYVVTRFQKKSNKKTNLQQFALIFKNVNLKSSQLEQRLKNQFHQGQIKEIFSIYRLQPYYSLTNQRLQTYYQYLIEKNQSKKEKLLKKLGKLNNKCNEALKEYNIHSDRIIVVLNTKKTRNAIFKAYQSSYIQRISMAMNLTRSRIICEQCPPVQEIIWNNIGQNEVQKFKYKYLSIFYFILLVAGSYMILAVCLKIVYQNILPEPWQSIAVNIILIFVVILGLFFRQLMNFLSQMRHPNTQSHRTFFVVLTTVVFHLIYYLLIPTVYFKISEDKQKSQTLKLIGNQAVNFMIVQIILAGFDLMFCLWNRKQKLVRDEDNPIGCQRILHKNIQYPRFPIEFKLIILFKFWSFTMFFAFQVPFVLFIIFLTLIYLYFKDKHSVYYHYRMEIINNTVQYQFLKIYSNLFSAYLLIMFLMTQHMEIQILLSILLTLLAVLAQIFFIKDRSTNQRNNQDEEEDEDEDSRLDRIDIQKYGYARHYKTFISFIEDQTTNNKIMEELTIKGLISLNTESLTDKQQLI